MVIELTLFGFVVFSLVIGKAREEPDPEVVHNTGGEFERAVPFGFWSSMEDDEE